jgi:hypothetical protein
VDIELSHAGVPVTVLDGHYVESGKPTQDAVAYYTHLIERLDELRAFAASELLGLYNETWLTDEIGVLDRAGFVERLSSPSITLYDAPGAAHVHFEDGDIFGGHWIEVVVRDGVPEYADLAG